MRGLCFAHHPMNRQQEHVDVNNVRHNNNFGNP